jgi:hypothetical protein
MQPYNADTERLMKRLFDSLSEKDRRRYAAVEAAKLGQGGIEYVAALLGCDAKTIRQGRADLGLAEDTAADRVRKKGWTKTADSRLPPNWKKTSCGCCATTRPATRCGSK